MKNIISIICLILSYSISYSQQANDSQSAVVSPGVVITSAPVPPDENLTPDRLAKMKNESMTVTPSPFLDVSRNNTVAVDEKPLTPEMKLPKDEFITLPVSEDPPPKN